MHTVTLRAIPILLAVLLCNCGAPRPPQCVSVPMFSRMPAATLLSDARQKWEILKNPSHTEDWESAKTSYNLAVAKLFDQLRCGSGSWESRATRLGTTIAPPGKQWVDLNKLDAVFPATKVNTRLVVRHQKSDGIGVPLVGWRKTTPVGVQRAANLLPTGLPYSLTVTLAFTSSGAKPVWQFTKRWLYDDLPIGKTRHPLAADWTAPNAFYWQMCDLDDLKIQNVILPERFSKETGLYFLQPYDPAKIPVVFVHGLVSSPDAFKNIINDLAPEPWFRQNYQIWLFNYPTGNPWLYSAVKFREQMRAAAAMARSQGDAKNLERMVIVSHSMGGLLARSSVTDPGTKFYDAVFKTPIHQLKVSTPTRDLIREATLYQPLTEPERVIFLAVPHQGSPVATFRVAVWISRLIQLPKKLTIELLDATIQGVNDALKGDQARPNMPNSISSLSPKDKSNIALASMPLPRSVTFHSIIGDRGRGGTPESSDGVVPYWSSHVQPVASELIVPSNHSVPDNAEAAAEVKRLLKLHLRGSAAN